MKRLTIALWVILVVGFSVQCFALYLIRSSCYNQTIAHETKQEISYKRGICTPTMELSLTAKQQAFRIYMSLIYILPGLFFVCVVMLFKLRSERRSKEKEQELNRDYIMDDCLFCKIIKGNIPSNCIYEDDQVYAFYDIDPKAPVHFLVIPKKHIATLNDLTEADEKLVGHIVLTAQRIANKLGCEQGFRVVMNCNEMGGQTVYHIHMHVLGQRQLDWPPG